MPHSRTTAVELVGILALIYAPRWAIGSPALTCAGDTVWTYCGSLCRTNFCGKLTSDVCVAACEKICVCPNTDHWLDATTSKCYNSINDCSTETELNGTMLWWDGLTGDNLVCRPGESEGEYALTCLMVTRIVPSITLCCGIGFLCMAWLKQNSTRRVRPENRSSQRDPRPPVPRPHTPQQIKSKATASMNGNSRATVALFLGILVVSWSLAFLINGYGTMYASDTLAGVSGDAFQATYYCTVWYLNLGQVRGAKWFRGLVHLSTWRDGGKQKSSWFTVPSATSLLDLVQGRLGPFIALFLWVLLAVGVLPRSWFYTVGHTMCALFGLRAFFVIATQRVTGLRKVALMQNTVRGTADDKKRRKAILKSKLYGLAIDLAGVAILSVIPPLSLTVLRSTFSSHQLLIHYAGMLPFIVLAITLYLATTCTGMKRVKKRPQSLSTFKSDSSLPE